MKKFFKNWFPNRSAVDTEQPQADVGRIHPGKNQDAILYQTWGIEASALWYIDQGYQNALRQNGNRWAAWDPNSDPQILVNTIKKLEPGILLLNLQTLQRSVSSWSQPGILRQLLDLKQSIGFRVACRSHPSNLNELFQQYPIDFSIFRDNVRSFYQQPQHPDVSEAAVFQSGFIDVIRSAFFHGTYQVGFRNYLDLGCKILEEPHAADLLTYGCEPEIKNPGDDSAEFDILFVGGCWPFKWKSMEPYITALTKKFGPRFRIYGNGWPTGMSAGHLRDDLFNATLRTAKINLTLHELSQTLEHAISGNERVFKLGALNCFAMSDANPLIPYHFDVANEVAYSRTAEEMVEQVEFFLAHPELRRQRAWATRRCVINEHSYLCRLNKIVEALDSLQQIIDYRPVQKASVEPWAWKVAA